MVVEVSPRVSRERILGQPVDAVSREMAVDLVVERALEQRRGAYVCLTNVHSTVESQRSEDLRAASETAFLSVPDGMPLAWILRHRGYRHTQKVTGIEYMPEVASAGLRHGVRHFMFGGRAGVAEAAARGLKMRVPETEIVGAYSPSDSPNKERELNVLRDQVREQRPHIMWVGLGAPKQEIWMSTVAGTLDVPIMVGVGAAFDFLGGTKRAAPRFISRLGLEWSFRLLAEPRRLWRRYLLGNSEFLWLLLWSAFAKRASWER
jgi:N-acetylglucosaminyldiphosphoundecaprenol N-acetyl-beta-D-mannosaminyltransferase